MIDSITIIGIAERGIHIIDFLLEAGRDAFPVINAIKNMFAKGDKVTEEELKEVETLLDSLVDEFNIPLED